MENMEKGHLPILGVGPLYVVTIILMTIISITLSATGIIPVITFANFQWIFILIGILCFIIGITLWLKAVIIDRLDAHIIKNELVTTGVYAYVRNPVYSAFMFVCTGVLLIYGNLVLLVLPIIYWGFMTVLMKSTEEKWLENLYGKEYIQYRQRVNRCIPWKGKSYE
jgi:conserved domain protein